jgi:hypothetical protein
MTHKLKGKCLCGAVVYEIEADKAEADACHCDECRRWSGHYWASVNAPLSTLVFHQGEDRIGWRQSSAMVRRGFCRDCGSALFWHPNGNKDYAHIIAASAGSLDRPTTGDKGVTLTKHIFVAEKGDYYELGDGLPQRPGI